MTDAPPPVEIEPAPKSLFGLVSIVWVIPLLALAIALGVAWQSYSSRGPLIEIEFTNAAGIAKRETELRYRDVSVGVVEDLKFAPDLSAVVAYVRLDKEVAPFVDEGSTFWVVRPELTARGVSGLDTILSGVYLEGSWDGKTGPAQTRFKGLNEAPLFRHNEKGIELTLRTTAGGSLTDNSPITFRGIEVGRVGKASISKQGSFAIAEAIIYHPHSDLVSSATRFWDTSGFTFSVGPSGAEIDFSSFATLVGGGITFDTFVSGGERVIDGSVFEVFADEKSARNSLFNASEVETLEMRVVFEGNISGLAVGAPVELSGLKIGEVESVSGIIDQEAFGDSRVRLNALLSIQPARLGMQDEVTAATALAFLTQRIEEGLRARLASAGLLAGGLKIELVQVDDAPGATVETGQGIVPIIPTTDSEITDAGATVEGFITRVNNLPIEELLNSAIEFLESAEVLISNEELRETPEEILALLSDIRGIVNSEDVQSIPVSLSAALARFDTLLTQLEDEKLVARLGATADAATAAANGVTSSVEGIPSLVAQIEAVAANIEDLPLKDLTGQLTALSASADEFLAAEDTRQLPGELGNALKEVSATLSELREGGAVNNVNSTLEATSRAADAVATSAEDLPILLEQFRGVLDQASGVIAGYDKGEVISRDARAALRDISIAADAMASLARMLERDPSSILRGR